MSAISSPGSRPGMTVQGQWRIEAMLASKLQK